MSINSGAAKGAELPATAFSGLSDKELYSLYQGEKWNSMSIESKQQLLQETANRETLAYGGTYAVTVKLDKLDDGVYGVQNGRTVTLDVKLVGDGKVSYTYNGKEVEIDVPDSGWQSLETVLHEVRHTWQDEVAAGRITAEEEKKEAFEANGFTVSDVDGQKGLHYMTGEKDFNLYLLNPTEADANIYAQNKTSRIVEEMRAQGVIDASTDVYSKGIESKGYEKRLSEIKGMYGENIDKQVENTLKNLYNKTDEPVDPRVESAVKAEMVASYQAAVTKESKVDITEGAEGKEWSILSDGNEGSGILDNDPADFRGPAPSLDLGVADSDSVETSGAADGTGESSAQNADASVSADSSEGSSSDGGNDGGLDN